MSQFNWLLETLFHCCWCLHRGIPLSGKSFDIHTFLDQGNMQEGPLFQNNCPRCPLTGGSCELLHCPFEKASHYHRDEGPQSGVTPTATSLRSPLLMESPAQPEIVFVAWKSINHIAINWLIIINSSVPFEQGSAWLLLGGWGGL